MTGEIDSDDFMNSKESTGHTEMVEARHCPREGEFFALQDRWLLKRRRGRWIGDMRQPLRHVLWRGIFPVRLSQHQLVPYFALDAIHVGELMFSFAKHFLRQVGCEGCDEISRF